MFPIAEGKLSQPGSTRVRRERSGNRKRSAVETEAEAPAPQPGSHRSDDDAELDECLNFNSLTKDSLDSKKSKFSNKNISTSLGSSFLLINISFI